MTDRATRSRFDGILSAFGLGDGDGRLYLELVERHAEPHRQYHDLRHVDDCLGHLDDLPVEGTDPATIEVAIWFHDAVYDPYGKDNEGASAELARRSLGQLGADGDRIERVVHLILATRHDAVPDDLDAQRMVDIDLAILGSDRRRFEAYEGEIRGEYRKVPGFLFRRKRKQILRGFLERESLYLTAPFVERFEETARSNLAWSIECL
ncbi:MAG: N-methyl-D-aspartate receptor NMDAR2C subunit [Acidobacteriota bacterium]